ncbi:MAG: nuclear transport factor 2 family protein [Caulobacterales bacterium]
MPSDPRFEDIWDQHCIKQAMERYCRGCDRMDGALIDSAFWPDAHVDMGPWQGPGKEVSGLLLPIFKNDNAATMHMIMQSHIEVTGPAAVGDTYFFGMHRREKDGVSMMAAFGRYVDRFEKRHGEWRIAARTVVMEHLENHEAAAAGDLSMDMFRRGRRGDGADLSYEGRTPVN